METSLTAPVRRPGARGPRRPQRPGGRAGAAAPDRAARRPDEAPSRQPAGPASGRRPGQRRPGRRFCREQPAAPRVARARLRRRARRGRADRSPTCTDASGDPPACDLDTGARASTELLAVFADLAGSLTRPRHDETDPGAELAAQPAASTCTRTCARSTPRREGLPDAVRSPCSSGPSPTTASTASTARRSSRRPATGCSCAGAARRRRSGSPSSRSSIAGSSRSSAVRAAWARTSASCSIASSAATEGRDPGRRRPRPGGALPLLRRAGDRGRHASAAYRRGRGAARGAWPPTRSAAGPGRPDRGRSSIARGRWPRC